MAAFAAVALDEYLDLRKWKRVAHMVRDPSSTTLLHFTLAARTRPPPIGCMDWPAGRALLEWAATDGLHRAASASTTVLEIGSGVGTTAVGLALLAEHAAQEAGASHESGAPAPRVTVIATDVCHESLSNLRRNAAANGLSLGECSEIVSASPQQDLGMLHCRVWQKRRMQVGALRSFSGPRSKLEGYT